MTAGLGAYLVSIGGASPDVNLDSPRALWDHIVDLSYPRGAHPRLKTVYNGARPWEAWGSPDVNGPVRLPPYLIPSYFAPLTLLSTYTELPGTTTGTTSQGSE